MEGSDFVDAGGPPPPPPPPPTQDVLRRLGVISPGDIGLYERALRHRSLGRDCSNERLEFLGDSVLATAVSRYVVLRYPNDDEGFLSKMRSKLVRGSTLTVLARRIGLRDCVELAPGVDAGKRDDDAVLEDAFEAFVGALFLDKGFDAAADWVRHVYERHVDFSEVVQHEVTPKDQLLRESRRAGVELTFEATRRLGVPEGLHKVIVRATSSSSPAPRIVGVGEGANKRDATDEACDRALQHFRRFSGGGAEAGSSGTRR